MGTKLFYVLILLLCSVTDSKSQDNRRRGRARTATVNTLADQPYSGQRIRLRTTEDLPDYNEGIIEVFRGGNWGLVCDDDWDVQDADVACRQLGFSLGAEKPFTRRPANVSGLTITDFIINNLQCSGNEGSLLSCSYSTNTECDLTEAVSVQCSKYSKEDCGDSTSGGWIPGDKSCYKIRETKKGDNFRKILKACAGENERSYLATIETEAEHDFISNLLFSHRTGIDRAYLSAKLSKKKNSDWRWQQFTQRASGKKKWKGALKKNAFKMDYIKWFPGWNPDKFSAGPSSVKGKYQCMTLSNRYRHQSGQMGTVDFYYFDGAPCKPSRKENTFYICETPRKPSLSQSKQASDEDCYQGNGNTYRGSGAVTMAGTSCIKWTLSEEANPSTHPNTGLGDHNFCRNPDDDKQPWCWVKVGTNDFGYCDIPQCDVQPVTTTTVAPNECPAGKFFCYNHVKSSLYVTACIPQSFHCDNEKDCDEGEDEVNCDYKLPLFTLEPGHVIQTGIKERYVTITLEYCARLCIQSMNYVCRSVSYKAETRNCLLSEHSTHTGQLSSSWDFDFYELKSQKDPDCPGRYSCGNGRCVSLDDLCDGVDQCQDFSDEDGCGETDDDSLEVRLVGGEDLHSGRVEIKYHGEWGVICDDDWDIKDAIVVCKMLGYGHASAAISRSKYGSGNGNILLDDVNCYGNETSLLSCETSAWKDHDCKDYEIAGVQCQQIKSCNPDEFTCSNKNCIHNKLVCNGRDDCLDNSDEKDCVLGIALVNGKENEGRVEITRNGVHGTICDDLWDDHAAKVVCRMLGYSFGIAKAGGSYGNGSGLIWLDDVVCDGTEASLDDCQHSAWGKHDCDHTEDAGVICSNETQEGTSTTEKPFIDVQISLSGNSSTEGRVVLHVNGVEGSICDDDFDDKDASVICRMMGFQSGEALENTVHLYGEGRGHIWVDDLQCGGDETSLLLCSYTSNHDCSHAEDAGVICHDPPTSVLQVELDGDTDEGLVKITWEGFTGGICMDSLQRGVPDVICRSLGFSGSERVFTLPSRYELWLNGLTCLEGTKTSLSDCYYQEEPWWDFTCAGGSVALKCSSVITTTTTVTTTTAVEVTDQPGSVSVRLVGGSFEGEGRIEISKGQLTGSICDDYWDYKDARVICRMLGYSNGLAVRQGLYGPGDGPILLDNVQCVGTEDDISDCPHAGWDNSNCDHTEDAGVVCGSETFSGTAVVELVDGGTPQEGRVEVTYAGVKGTLCSHGFDVVKATVICRMLGFSGGFVQPDGTFPAGSGMIWAAEKWECLGSEDNVDDCEHFPAFHSQCNHAQDVGIYCHNVKSTTTTTTTTRAPTTTTDASGIRIELVNGGVPHRGRVEIIRNGERGTVCDDRWDDSDAAVICRMMGYTSGGTAVTEAVYGAGTGTIHLDDVECEGTESSIDDCTHAGWGVTNCYHGEDAGVRCKVDTGTTETGDDWHALFSPDCGNRPMEENHIRRKRDNPVLGEATVRERPQPDNPVLGEATVRERPQPDNPVLGEAAVRERPQPAKIVYGSEAEYGMFPWQVGVRKVYYYDYFRGTKVSSEWCGGTILNKYWILSAAHCFDGIPKSKISIRVGDHNHKYHDDYEVEYDVEAILMHENYDSDTFDYDIALVKISSDDGTGILFNDYVQPACLPSMDTEYRPGTLCYISGWGKTEHGVTPNDLQKEKVPLLHERKCRSFYKKGALTSQMFCAGYEEGGIDTCQGDSGGPLVCQVDGKYTVFGATSWGNGCGDTGSPGVYAHVRNLLPWIIDQIKKYN